MSWIIKLRYNYLSFVFIKKFHKLLLGQESRLQFLRLFAFCDKRIM